MKRATSSFYLSAKKKSIYIQYVLQYETKFLLNYKMLDVSEISVLYKTKIMEKELQNRKKVNSRQKHTVSRSTCSLTFCWFGKCTLNIVLFSVSSSLVHVNCVGKMKTKNNTKNYMIRIFSIYVYIIVWWKCILLNYINKKPYESGFQN